MPEEVRSISCQNSYAIQALPTLDSYVIIVAAIMAGSTQADKRPSPNYSCIIPSNAGFSDRLVLAFLANFLGV